MGRLSPPSGHPPVALNRQEKVALVNIKNSQKSLAPVIHRSVSAVLFYHHEVQKLVGLPDTGLL